jgi:hypothetical protein
MNVTEPVNKKRERRGMDGTLPQAPGRIALAGAGLLLSLLIRESKSSPKLTILSN